MVVKLLQGETMMRIGDKFKSRARVGCAAQVFRNFLVIIVPVL